MARKVFISFLGTNNYIESHYKFPNDEISAPVRFIQEALILNLCKEWTVDDKVYIFCTDDSEQRNWKDDGHERISSDIEKIGLKSRLKANFPLFEIVEMKKIPDGFSEIEIWGIFNCVYGVLQENDEIYFDVTHAFRSIPLFSTVLFNYSGFMKQSNLKGIMYGAFEKIGPATDVKKMPLEERIAPIIDLTNVIRLQQFTDVVSSFVSFGRLRKISDTLNQYADTHPSIKQIKQGIESFDEYMMSNRMNEIRQGKWFIAIKNALKPLRRSDLPEPLKAVIQKMADEFSEFVDRDDKQNIIAAIHWAVKYEMVFSAYIMGEEYIITEVAEKYKEKNPFIGLEEYQGESLDKKKRNKRFRDFIGSVLGISNDDVVSRNYKNSLQDFETLADELLKEQFILNLREHYIPLAKNRNSLGHAKGEADGYKAMLGEFCQYFESCMNVINA